MGGGAAETGGRTGAVRGFWGGFKGNNGGGGGGGGVVVLNDGQDRGGEGWWSVSVVRA